MVLELSRHLERVTGAGGASPPYSRVQSLWLNPSSPPRPQAVARRLNPQHSTSAKSRLVSDHAAAAKRSDPGAVFAVRNFPPAENCCSRMLLMCCHCGQMRMPRAHAHVWLMKRFHFQPRQLRRTGGRSRSEKERDHETYLRNHICGRVHRRLHAGVCGGCSRRRRNCARRRHDPWTVSWSASDDGAQSAGPDSGSASGSRAATGHQWATESINRAPTDGLAAAVG